jgi:hypothetical protein
MLSTSIICGECQHDQGHNRCEKDDGAVRLFFAIAPAGTSGLSLVPNIPTLVPIGDSSITGFTAPALALIAGTKNSYDNFSQASFPSSLTGTLYYNPTTIPPTTYASASIVATLALVPNTNPSIVSPVALSITNNSGATVTLTPTVYGVFSFVFIKCAGDNNCCIGRGMNNNANRGCPLIFFQTGDSPSWLHPFGTITASSLFTSADAASLSVQPFTFNGNFNNNCNVNNSCNQRKRVFAVYSITSVGAGGQIVSATGTRSAIFIGYVSLTVSSITPLTITGVTLDGCSLLIPSNSILVEVRDDKRIDPIDIFMFGAEIPSV